jgi:nucleoid DNA-binding protein
MPPADPEHIKRDLIINPPRVWSRKQVRSTAAKIKARNAVPEMKHWGVSHVGVTGNIIFGQIGNINHPPLNLRDICVAMIAWYDNNERKANPSLAPMNRDALMGVMKLAIKVILNALANAQKITIDGFGTFVPIYQPNYVRTIRDEATGRAVSREIVEHWGTFALITSESESFGEELGKTYARDLPAEGLTYFQKQTINRREKLQELIEEQKRRKRQAQSARSRHWALVRNGYRPLEENDGKINQG